MRAKAQNKIREYHKWYPRLQANPIKEEGEHHIDPCAGGGR